MSHRIARPRTGLLRRFIVAMIGILAVTAFLRLDGSPVSASTNAAYTETYVVVAGDRLASIARQYCTTWQELYDLNRQALGSNPNHLPAGTTITVINRCGSGGEGMGNGGMGGDWGSGDSGGVYDRGPTAHAQGTVNGSTYYVVRNDTIFSISNRFGVSERELMRVNNLHSPYKLQAGQTLTIPGLGPDPKPTEPWLTITNPTSGSYLASTFTVSGRGRGIYEGNVVIQAKDAYGTVLAEVATTLQGSNAGSGGEGSYSAQLAVNVGQNTPGSIVVTSPGTPATASVPVIYNRIDPAWVTIEYPTSGTYLDSTFTVSGRGAGLYEGNVVVQAKNAYGVVLAERSTTLQGSSVGTGGEGTYSVQLTVNTGSYTSGSIVVFSPGTAATASVPVIFNGTDAWLSIESPTSGSYLPATFTVSGRGAGLFEGNVLVQARDSYGVLLAEVATTLQGNSVGTGGEGSYSVQLTVIAGYNRTGAIVVSSPGSLADPVSVPVTFNSDVQPSFIIIESPTEGANLQAAFTVSGSGGGLYEGNVVVQARDLNGRVLLEQATTLQGSNVGTGGVGTWSLQMTINQAVDGEIVAFSTSPAYVEDRVSVRYNNNGSNQGPTVPIKTFGPGECRVTPRIGAPAYGAPNGVPVDQFSGGEYEADRGVYTTGAYWYYVNMAPGTNGRYVYVKGSDLLSEQGSCTW